VLYVAEERKQSSLDGFWPTLSAEQMASIEAVAMDMWDPYVASTQAHLPGAESKIVFDKFHVAKHLSEAVDQVRRREHKTLKAAGDDRLSGTRYDWLRNRATMEPERPAAVRCATPERPEDGAGLGLERDCDGALHYIYERPARKHFRWWWNWAQRSRLEPIKRVARHAQTPLRKHHHLSPPPHHQRGQRIAQRQDPMGEVHGTRIIATGRTSSTPSTSTAAGSSH
jgi:transposase